MRSARVDDYWRKVYSRNYNTSISSINLNNLNGIENIEFRPGIFALCGLNGAGKSTVITCLKELLGIKMNSFDRVRVRDVSKNITFKLSGKEYCYSNSNLAEINFAELGSNKIVYLDHIEADKALVVCSQDNFDELVEQNEERYLNEEELAIANYLVGKEYSEISVLTIEEYEAPVPYFKVKIHDQEYDSLRMGSGEHFLMYIFWQLMSIEKESIVIIEEPETFISINAQRNLMNYIAKIVSEMGVMVVISTHSPFILRSIKVENICVINRFLNQVAVTNPETHNDVLRNLGLELPKLGIIYVEDYVAKLLVFEIIRRKSPSIKKDFDFEITGGESYITSRLNFPKSEYFSYKLIGLYDGDMKSKFDEKSLKINWAHHFIPIDSEIEVEFRICISKNISQFADYLSITCTDVVSALSKISGLNYHDWFLDFAKELCLEYNHPLIIKAFYDFWIREEGNEAKVNTFIEDLNRLCYGV